MERNTVCNRNHVCDYYERGQDEGIWVPCTVIPVAWTLMLVYHSWKKCIHAASCTPVTNRLFSAHSIDLGLFKILRIWRGWRKCFCLLCWIVHSKEVYFLRKKAPACTERGGGAPSIHWALAPNRRLLSRSLAVRAVSCRLFFSSYFWRSHSPCDGDEPQNPSGVSQLLMPCSSSNTATQGDLAGTFRPIHCIQNSICPYRRRSDQNHRKRYRGFTGIVHCTISEIKQHRSKSAQ